MSGLSIAPYFPFRRINVVRQEISPGADDAHLHVQPDGRFQPRCHRCGCKAAGVHSWTTRKIRDLNIASARIWVTCRYRKVFCSHCQGVHIEDLELFHPYLRVTVRLARYVYQLCRVMTVSEVARHLKLDWKTVKAIDKHYLERDYGDPTYEGLRTLAVDEIAVRKGHRYLTVVVDYATGRVLFVGKDRKAKTLERFFNRLKPRQRKAIEAVAMDMWDPFIRAVKKNFRRPGSSSTCSMWWPALAGSSTRCATASTARPLSRTKRFTKAANTCCCETAKTSAVRITAGI